jgi:hypothetical protein
MCACESRGSLQPRLCVCPYSPECREVCSRKSELLRAGYESTSEMKIVTPPVAKFSISATAA